ncbi:hypothetical protein [Epiphyas postvittana nucleopolyhedrovirus]|uniref:Uncharacterized protein n=1 Tax=Epiphyas postvittana nucleopolyhedrovirus TaxID=70600 RepID=Q91GP2_NPVEP|nr:hypothetical protein [Epiphyas postvittana nucleopolyhedrovirus]AAK85569.1 unknown [Epiphyas postvittana nucleopolyhedrovirus]
MIYLRYYIFFVFFRESRTKSKKPRISHIKLFLFYATLHYNMNRRINNAPVMVAGHDYDREQLKRDINSLRHSVHELCKRSTTGFDCNRLLESSTDTAKPTVVIKTTAAEQHTICDKL